jgi:nucleotide-binding universal stress UspA family protein
MARFALGSVAGQVVHEARAPVLLVRPLAEQPRSFDSMLVPLDGSLTAEAVLSPVETLASALGARVTLLTVTDGSEVIASSYLEGVTTRLSAAKLGNIQSQTVQGRPADQIISIAEREHVSLIAMATHGRTGVRHWILGSVAEEVLHRATIPTLLVRSHTASSPTANP